MRLLIIFMTICVSVSAQEVRIDGKFVPSKVIDMTGKTSTTGPVEDVAIIIKPQVGKRYQYTITEVVPPPVVSSPVKVTAGQYTTALYRAIDLNAKKTKLTLRYALVGTAKATIIIGTYSTTIDLTTTGNWTTYMDKSVTIAVSGGVNDISLSTTMPVILQTLKFE